MSRAKCPAGCQHQRAVYECPRAWTATRNRATNAGIPEARCGLSATASPHLARRRAARRVSGGSARSSRSHMRGEDGVLPSGVLVACIRERGALSAPASTALPDTCHSYPPTVGHHGMQLCSSDGGEEGVGRGRVTPAYAPGILAPSLGLARVSPGAGGRARSRVLRGCRRGWCCSPRAAAARGPLPRHRPNTDQRGGRASCTDAGAPAQAVPACAR